MNGEGWRYDRETDRWILAGRELHCGDGLEVHVGTCWLPVRIELDQRHGWLLYTDDDTVRILPSRSLTVRHERERQRRNWP